MGRARNIVRKVTKSRGPLKGPVDRAWKAHDKASKKLAEAAISGAKKYGTSGRGVAGKAASWVGRQAVRFGKTYK